MSLSTIVFHYSKSSLLRQHPPLLSEKKSPQRRALSYEQLFSTTEKFNPRSDQSVLASGCSLAMDFSRNFDRENASLSSASSSSTIHTDEESTEEKKNKQFKWKLRINK